MLRPTALDHVGLKVTDMDKTLQFYQRLGLTLLRASGPERRRRADRGDPGGEPGAQPLLAARPRVVRPGESRRPGPLLPFGRCRVDRRRHRRLAAGRDRRRPRPDQATRRHGAVRPRSGRCAGGAAAQATLPRREAAGARTRRHEALRRKDRAGDRRQQRHRPGHRARVRPRRRARRDHGTRSSTLDQAKAQLGADALAIRNDAGRIAEAAALAETLDRPGIRLDAVFINAGVARLAPLEAVDERHVGRSASTPT